MGFCFFATRRSRFPRCERFSILLLIHSPLRLLTEPNRGRCLLRSVGAPPLLASLNFVEAASARFSSFVPFAPLGYPPGGCGRLEKNPRFKRGYTNQIPLTIKPYPMNPNVFTFYLTACSNISTKRRPGIPDWGIRLVTNRDIAPFFRGYLID